MDETLGIKLIIKKAVHNAIVAPSDTILREDGYAPLFFTLI